MKNILVINLKRHGDIVASANLINSIKVHFPKSHIKLLVYEGFQRSAQTINGINEIVAIDREKILMSMNNALFSPAIAVNSFHQTLSSIIHESWHAILNLSNDHVSTNLCSMFKALNPKASIYGLSFDENNQLAHSHYYTKVLNEILPEYPYTPYHLADLYQKIVDLPYRPGKYTLKSNEKYAKIASVNFNKIRSALSSSKPGVKLIGIQANSSNEQKDIPRETIINLVELILSSTNLHPILLSSPAAQDIKFCQEINQEFNNSLVTIEAEFMALSSVFQNIDYLISTDTSVKHFADLCSLPTLEINYNFVPFYRQGSTNPASLILSNSEAILQEIDKEMMSASVIFSSLKLLVDSNATFDIPKGYALFSPQATQDKISYVCALGRADKLLIQLEASRYLIENINGKDYELDLSYFSKFALQDFIDEQKVAVTHTTRLLLHTLRTIIQSKDNRQVTKEVGRFLCELLESSPKSLCKVALNLFRVDIDQPEQMQASNSLAFLEEKLYGLKTHLQCISTLLKRIESSLIDNIEIAKSGRQALDI
jgi:ADP-heptose:LPS heptosyltransferase